MFTRYRDTIEKIYLDIIGRGCEKSVAKFKGIRRVAHTGFEPVISALRGRRPGPLDECAKKIFVCIVSGLPPSVKHSIDGLDKVLYNLAGLEQIT